MELHVLERLIDKVKTFPDMAQDGHVSFSHNAEDLIVASLLRSVRDTKGIYVDIGAFHPYSLSNTFLLYLQGWRGLNVDANEESIAKFEAVRPGDRNLVALISDRDEDLTYLECESSALNSTCYPEDQYEAHGVKGTRRMHTLPISRLLDEHVGVTPIDFLDIDCEGMDEKILKGIDFTRYRPKVISIEMTLTDFFKWPYQEFLQAVGYHVAASTLTSVILASDEFHPR